MKKIRTKWITDDFFIQGFWLVYGSHKDSLSFINKKCNSDMSVYIGKPSHASCFFTSLQDGSATQAFLVVNFDFKNTLACQSAVLHECVHMTLHKLDDVLGIRHNAETDEVYAYYQQRMYEKVIKFLTK